MTSTPHSSARPAGLALELRRITKRFPGVLANDRVDFAVRPGEVHALLGENGAGKSTVSNVITGLYQPVQGEMLVNGQIAYFESPRDAPYAGFFLVRQDSSIVTAL